MLSALNYIEKLSRVTKCLNFYTKSNYAYSVTNFLTVLFKKLRGQLGLLQFFYNKSYHTFKKAQILDNIETQCQILLIHDYSY